MPRKKAARAGAAQSASPPDGTPAPIVLATHRSNFLLVGVPEVINWIDWLRSPDAAMPERLQVEFIRLQYADGPTSRPGFGDPAFLHGGLRNSSIIHSGGESLAARAFRHRSVRKLTSDRLRSRRTLPLNS